MKNKFALAGIALAAAISLAGCAKQLDSPADRTDAPFELSALITKTTTDGVHTSWAEDDAMNIFHAVAGTSDYVSDGEFTVDAALTGTFTGTLASTLDGTKSYDWYALYPYDSHVITPAATTKGYVTVGGIKQTQAGNDSPAHLSGEACPLYGVAKAVSAGDTPSLAMKQLSSAICVNVTNRSGSNLTVKSIAFTSVETIAGTYYIDFTGAEPVYTGSGDEYVSNTATLGVSGGTAIATGSSAKFYIAIKPHTVKSGQTITLSVNGSSKSVTLSSDASFAAGKVKTLNFVYDKATTVSSATISNWNTLFGTSYNGQTESETVNLSGTQSSVTVAVASGSCTNKGYIKNSEIRLYNGYTMSISVPAGSKITEIATTVGEKTFASGKVKADCGTLSINSGALTWTGSSEKVVLSISGTGSMATMTVSYTGSGSGGGDGGSGSGGDDGGGSGGSEGSGAKPAIDEDWLELPSGLEGSQYVVKSFSAGGLRNYTHLYDTDNLTSLWTAYPLSSSYIGSTSRPGSWYYNPEIDESFQVNVTSHSYLAGTYSRGHMCPNGSRNANSALQKQAFYVTNQVPQLQDKFNGTIWNALEDSVRSVATGNDEEIYVVTGVAFNKVGESLTVKYATPKDATSQKVPVPNYFYKLVLRVKTNSSGTVTSASTIGFWFEHKEYSGSDFSAYAVSVDEVEKWTGFDFFVNLPDSVEAAAETNSDWSAFKSF